MKTKKISKHYSSSKRFVALFHLCWYHSLLSFVFCVDISCFVIICDLLPSVIFSDFVFICDLLASVTLLSLVIYVDIIHFIICDLCWNLLLCCHLWSVLPSVTLLSFMICCHQWFCCHLWSVAISDFVVIGDLCWYHSLYHLWSVLTSFALLSFVICIGISDFVVICDLCWYHTL